MNEMDVSAILGALTRIKCMIFEDPSQPIKNCQHIVDAVLKEIDENDVGLPVDLEN